MYTPVERCDRTAYVSGMHHSISDIELFEVFNNVAHVEKVIVRNSTVRHALIVFKSVEGLYMALRHFQGYVLHGRPLHIRTLRESSHSNGEIQPAFSNNSRPTSVQEHFNGSSNFSTRNDNRNYIAHFPSRHHSFNSNNRRRSFKSFQPHNEPFVPRNIYPANSNHLFGFNPDHIHYEDYSESSKQFDNLANIVRASVPVNPFNRSSRQGDVEVVNNKAEGRSRSNSSKDSLTLKNTPPTWKMELQIKRNEVNNKQNELNNQQVLRRQEKMTAEQLINKIACLKPQSSGEFAKKKPPHLSVINPSLFYEQNPRTSSPLSLAYSGKVQSPHDPAVLAYRHAQASNGFDALSPIDVQNCSFVTKHLGTNFENTSNLGERREMTNDELSDMIVSTGNLRINVNSNSVQNNNSEPAPWSPVKRLRAESGSVSMTKFASPQFSPIKSKSVEFTEIDDDDVFCSENNFSKYQSGNGELSNSSLPKKSSSSFNKKQILLEQQLPNQEDINNSRLPSNSHSANLNSDKREFVFPDLYPLCRHSSVPSISHLVNNMSDFGQNSHHVTVGMKMETNDSALFSAFQNSSSGRSSECSINNSKKLSATDSTTNEEPENLVTK